jgi:hypothetical protein
MRIIAKSLNESVAALDFKVKLSIILRSFAVEGGVVDG